MELRAGTGTSPLTRWLHYLVQSRTLWTAPIMTLLFASLVRWAVALNPYSGFNTPPMYGDYEAQRHWMEITTHLDTKDWYRYDSSWWGLDYPPMSAYHSWLCGIIGKAVNPVWFAFEKSRGFESTDSKFFMRATAFVSEAVIYIPAVLAFCRIHHGNDGLQKYIAAMLVLLQPALILVDHGHFQFNSVMLGLSLWAWNAFIKGHYLLGSVFFCLSLGFKQMALYYALPVFSFLIGRCLIEPRGMALFCKLGATVATTFAVMFWPWLSVNELVQVIHRIFPVARGLYEDKVANVWCALNIIVKLRSILSLQSTLRLSLLCTFAAVVPVSVHLSLDPSRKRLIYALANGSLAFFLFSFQVHEKSILLPALPITLLVLEEHTATSIFMSTAMFSMFPLLKREGLTLCYFVTTTLWHWIMGNYSTTGKSFAQIAGVLGTQGLFALWHIAECCVSPPPHLPDLFTVANVIISCAAFGLTLVYFLYRQFTLVPDTRTGRLKTKTH